MKQKKNNTKQLCFSIFFLLVIFLILAVFVGSIVKMIHRFWRLQYGVCMLFFSSCVQNVYDCNDLVVILFFLVVRSLAFSLIQYVMQH